MGKAVSCRREFSVRKGIMRSDESERRRRLPTLAIVLSEMRYPVLVLAEQVRPGVPILASVNWTTLFGRCVEGRRLGLAGK